MKAQRKQFIVLGLGRFGSALAIYLSRMGHEVLAVDQNETLVADVSPYVTQAIQADAADEAVLRDLDVGSFDAAVVAIGSDTRASVLSTVLCKECGVKLVIAKAEDELHAKVLRKVGADRVIFPERDMGQRVARTLDTPNILELMELSGDYRIAEVIVPETWCGHTVLGVNVRRNFGVSIIGVRRQDRFLPSPGADFSFEAGDVLLLLGRHQDIDAL